ncbi:MAG: hypothetical protein Q8N56_02765 [bacterium]|nr:hypothetical protein [bacterium]
MKRLKFQKVIFVLAIGFLSLLFSVNTASGTAGVPKILSHQGRLLNSAGELLGGSAGLNYCFRFAIWNMSTGGTRNPNQLWPAEYAVPSTMTINVKNGVFNVGIGDTSVPGEGNTLTFNFQDYDTVYLDVEVATKVGATCAPGDGEEVFENLSPRQRIVSSGYAINSDTVDKFHAAQSAAGDQIPVLTSGNLIFGGTDPQLNVTGTNTLTLQGGALAGTIIIGNSASTALKLGKFTSENAIIYTADGTSDGTLASIANGTTGQCLVATTGLAPAWGSCGGGSQTPWTSDIDADNWSLLDFGPNLTSRAALTIASAAGTTSTGLVTLASGNASAGTAGNIAIDVGTSTSSNGTISIGTAARAQTITIGNTTGGTITIGGASGSDLLLQDANWGITGAGAATLASVNKVALTQPTNSATLTIADQKTLTVNNSLTFSGADAKTINFGSNSIALTTSGDTTLTLPASGTMATLTGSETISNKTFSSDINFLDANPGTAYTVAGSDSTTATVAGGDLTMRAGAGLTTGAGGNLIIAAGTSPSGTAGYLALQTAGAEKLRVQADGNFLFEKGAQDVILAVTAPAATTRTYTIPDFGANDSFVALAATQALTNKTIGSTGLIFSGATTDIDAATGEGLTIQGRAASSFITTTGNITFQAAGSGTTGTVQIGAGGVGSDTPDFFGLDVKLTTGDPAGGAEGYMYYNTLDNKFRCYQNSAWTDCIGTGGGGVPKESHVIFFAVPTAISF